MTLILRSTSAKVLLALAVLLLLEWFPYTGLFLMALMGPFIAGVLVHVFLGSVAIESLTGRLPRLCLLLPIGLYSAYYGAYFAQGYAIYRTSSALSATNPGLLLQFDPRRHALVMQHAGSFVNTHAVEVAYEPNPNHLEKYAAYRLFPKADCDTVGRDSQSRIGKIGVRVTDRLRRAICQLRQPEVPNQDIVTITVFGEPEIWKRKWDIREQTTEVLFDGRVLGKFTTAYVWRLPAFPKLAIGCGLISSGTPRWSCFADFMRNSTSIAGIPNGIDATRFDTPVSVMLGIPKYSVGELQNYAGYPANAEALRRARGEPERVEDEVFEQLAALLAGRTMTLPHNMGYSLAQRPDRLAPFARQMVDLFLSIHAMKVSRRPYRGPELEMLSTAIPALPTGAFAEVADRLLAAARTDKFYEGHPAIYLRVADAGAAALPLYREHAMTDKVRGYLNILPVLAVCRIGQADAELMEKLKQEFRDFDFEAAGKREETFFQAVLVTLLKLGQADFVTANYRNPKARHASWYDAVLAGKGNTAAGPNNCMPLSWPSTAFLSKTMAPSLRRQGNDWEATN